MILFRNNLTILIHARFLPRLVRVFHGCHLNDWILVDNEVSICCYPSNHHRQYLKAMWWSAQKFNVQDLRLQSE